MKRATSLTLILALSAIPGLGTAQSDGMKGMDMKDMPIKGMEMDKKAQATTHKAVGVVKQLDPAKGTVTFAHEPVKSLDWPAMTMAYGVKDKKLFDKLTVGKKVEFEFMQQGSNYVVTTVK